MILLLLLAQASLIATGEPAPAANMPYGKWATLRIEPSFGETRTEIAFGTLRYDRQAKQLDYWMRRGDRDRRDGSLKVRWADSRTCFAMRPVINAMKDMGAMQIAPPTAGDDIIVTADGTLYTLEAPGRYDDGHTGILRFSADVRTPLAAWAERVQSDLTACWSDQVPTAERTS